MTELQQAKLTAEINRLENEADELEDKIRGDTSRPKDLAINRNKVLKLRDKAGFLRSVQNGQVIESTSYLRDKIDRLKLEIDKLNQEVGETWLKINDSINNSEYLARIIK